MIAKSIAFHLFRRELIDQWRDRRTLLTVIFLPLLLYPILGLGMLQMLQFMGEKPVSVLVVGAQHLNSNNSEPPVALFGPDGWNSELITDQAKCLLQLQHIEFSGEFPSITVEQPSEAPTNTEQDTVAVRAAIQRELLAHSADVLLWIAPRTSDPSANTELLADDTDVDNAAPFRVQLFQNSASDQSRIAAGRVEGVLSQWYAANQAHTQAASTPASTEPFQYTANDLAPPEQLQSQLWARILPFILFLWTLTGAFYAAVDGCAGEKERGTLEALLVTPSTRQQIVLGKLLTTMTFSLTSGLVNLVGTIGTGLFVSAQMSALGSMGIPHFGPPPLSSLAWLLIGAVPISALFSAISLSVAAFARSSKEGQHYLLPILMTCLPLLTLPLIPGVQMDLGLSLLPISGLMFWLRALIEGEYWTAARFTLPIFVVNGWCVYLAISWAVVQFQQETVLFRPVERFSLTQWLRSVFQRHAAWPTMSQVVVLVGLIAGLKLLLQAIAPHPIDWPNFVAHTLIVLGGAVALPAIALAFGSTRAPFQTLQLSGATLLNVIGAFCLAVCFHPLIVAFQQWVMELYPLTIDAGQMQSVLKNILDGSPGMWAIVLLMAVTPALCEELAFRGFILSGLRRAMKPFNAVVITAILFGAMHGLLQQSIVASATGIILGFVALRTGSLWPCIVYHATHNALTLQFAFLDPQWIADSKWLSFFLDAQVDAQQQLVGLSYAPLPASCMIICGIWIAMILKPSTPASTNGTVHRSRLSVKPSVSEATP